jgi:glycosyltransferase involved in cell wall biosynthesis
MNFAFVCHLDPENVATWSGTPHSIIEHLRELGHSVTSVCPRDISWHLGARVKGRMYRHLFGKIYHAGRSPAVFRQRARAVSQQLGNLPEVDYVLAIFPVDAAFLQSKKPIAIIHDATWYQLLDFYPGLERQKLASESITDGQVLDRAALNNCTKAVYFSTWAGNSAIRDMRCDVRKVRTIVPGANLSTRPAKSIVLEFIKSRPKDRCKLLFVGQDWTRKGAAKAVAVVKSLNALGTPAELYIVGCRAPESETLPDFVHQLGFLNKNVLADRQAIERLFATSHFFVLPTAADCSPIVLCEAAAYGLPCLSHDVGGVASIVQRGKTGQLFSLASQPEEWAQWLQRTFADPEAYSQSALRAYEDAQTRLNWKSFCKELVDFLRS